VKDAIASAVALGAAFMEVFQERVDEIEYLRPLRSRALIWVGGFGGGRERPRAASLC